MRPPAAAMAFAMLAAIVGAAWASGCDGLSSDCALNLTCPPSTSSSTGAGPTCSGIVGSGACDACLHDACCQEEADCAGDGTCINDCLFGAWPSPPECSTGESGKRFQALITCLTANCTKTCIQTQKDQCNAVTNHGCPADGSACDAIYPGVLVCISGGTTAMICDPCNNDQGPYCDVGLRCHAASSQCARFCCTDADCGTGTCELDPAKVFGMPLLTKSDVVGVCVVTGGATPACDAPMKSTSMGTCQPDIP